MEKKWLFSLCVGMLLIISSFGFSFPAVADAPVQVQKGGNTIYHDYDELVNELQAIAVAYPPITKLVSLGQSWEGREIWAMKISDNVNIEEPDEPEVFFNGAHHSREWLTIEVNLFFIKYLVENYTIDPTATFLVDNRQIWVVPLVNPDGRFYDGMGPGDIPSTNQMWRKNRRDNGDGTWGVDLNRNYGFMWGSAGAAGQTNQQTYAGPGPFSEPETRAIRDFVQNHSFVNSISYHSYSQLVLWPWGVFYGPAPDSTLLRAIGIGISDNITNTVGSGHPIYDPTPANDLYITSGDDVDWLYGEMGILAYVIELYPHGSDGLPDPFHPPASAVVPVFFDNLGGMIFMAMIADNPNQVMDHITLTPDPESQLINQATTGQFTINALNDGLRDDVFDISTSSIAGWTINHPLGVSLQRNESKNFTLSVTVPPAYPGGDYTIWINATSQTNTTCQYGTSVLVTVPFYIDTAIISHSPFVENGQYPQGSINMRSVVMNNGQLELDPFNLTCTISQLGASITMPIFTENFEIDLSQWNVIDHDGSHSPSYWQRDSNAHTGLWGAWCGNGASYQDDTIQSLETAVPIDLRGTSGANLTFWHDYSIEQNWDFGTIQVSGDGGQTWSLKGRYTGNSGGWVQETVDLGEYAGSWDLVIRFFFSSDGGVTAAGWSLDDILVEADYRSENIIWGPTPELTPDILYQNDTLECSWQYTFSPGHYKATYETTLAADERPDNDMLDVVFEIIPATLPTVTVTQPNAGEVWPVGTSQEITWTAVAGSYPLSANPISIYYSWDGPGGPYQLIAGSEANDGSYIWDPIPFTPSIDCWILIEAEDDQGFLGSDTCDVAFAIPFEMPTVTVTSPNGGETLMGGGSWSITWTATGTLLPFPITIEYSSTGPGGPWVPIASNEANDGIYAWDPIPSLDSTDCFIRIIAEDILGFTGEDISDLSFRIDSTAPAPATNVHAELTATHVTIYWDPSADHGGGDNDVDHYEVYYVLNNWDPTGDSYGFLVDTGMATSYQHINAGVNNPSSYCWQVRTFDVAGHETRTIIQAGKTGSMQSVFANPSGWFMLGSHLVQSDTSLAHVIQGAGLPANWDHVQLFDAVNGDWDSYLKGRPDSKNDLTDITNEQGFWMHLTSSSRFSTAGYVEDMSIDLKTGWNLVPYPFAERTMTSADIIAHISANCPNYDGMEIFDSGAAYRLKIPDGTETLAHGSGFWVKVTADTIWMVTNYW